MNIDVRKLRQFRRRTSTMPSAALFAIGLFTGGVLLFGERANSQQQPAAAAPAAAAPMATTTERLPQPTAGQLADVQKKIRELYGRDIDNAKKPAEKTVLAGTLLKLAADTNDDPAARFELLTMSRDFAAAGGDVAVALAATEELLKHYQLDPLAEPYRVLKKWVDHPEGNPPGLSEAAASCIKYAEEFADKEDFPTAIKYARLALDTANKGRYTALIKQVTALGVELTTRQNELLEIPKAEQKLAADPNDSEANMQLGRWYWFRKNDAFSAMPYLAKTVDSPLKKAALAELANPVEAEAQAALADQWWALAQAVKDDTMKNSIRARALDWYQLALPKLVGLDKIKTEKRIAELKTLGTKTGSATPGAKPAAGVAGPLSPAERLKLALAAGGSKESEAAVDKGLKWIASVQGRDGGWNFDTRPINPKISNPGTAESARNGATAIALLPFLAAGYTHKTDNPYQATIKKGLSFLVQNTNPKYTDLKVGSVAWFEDEGTMYSHGLAAAAMCEAYGLTKDRALLAAAQGGLNFIALAQDPNSGGWRYLPRQAGDTSVHGWQFMALKAGAMANLKILPATIQLSNKFLDTVSDPKDFRSLYGYTSTGRGPAQTAIGLLCRMHSGWKKDNPGLQAGVAHLAQLAPSKTNFYFNYYANQVMFQWGGTEWEQWNRVLRDQIVQSQSALGLENGSWHSGSADLSTSKGGRLFCTSLACLMLEVYYRYPRVLEKKSGETSGLVY